MHEGAASAPDADAAAMDRMATAEAAAPETATGKPDPAEGFGALPDGADAAAHVDVRDEDIVADEPPQAPDMPVPAGFGGLDERAPFGRALSEAMLVADLLRDVPAWVPPLRLPGARAAAGRALLGRLCRVYLGIDPTDAVACSTELSGNGPVLDVIRFLRAHATATGTVLSEDAGLGEPDLRVLKAATFGWRGGRALVLKTAGTTGEHYHVLGPTFADAGH